MLPFHSRPSNRPPYSLCKNGESMQTKTQPKYSNKWPRRFTYFASQKSTEKGVQNLSIFYFAHGSRSGRDRPVQSVSITTKGVSLNPLQTGLGTPVFSTNKADRHDITGILYIYTNN